jgi:2-C-methyl-D-erythritol 2,4-cyclodiphosphate synthase
MQKKRTHGNALKDAEYLTGLGSDDHRIEKFIGKPLILGGTVVSREYGPVAHSDGDVVYHAITNALLLAIGERDIGYHFPDTDPDYKGVRGAKLVSYALKLVERTGYKLSNVTVMITAGRPKIGPHVESMRRNIAGVLGIDSRRVGVGATSGEGLSEIAKGNGINALAQVLLRKDK